MKKFEEEIREEIREEIKEKKSDNVILIFRELRSFDLHVDRVMYHFHGQDPLEVPRSVIESPDFNDQIKDLFLIKEV